MGKLDILAFGVHPDDVELGCGGTLIKHVKQGKKVGIIDLTLGQLGTRGTVEKRLQEAQKAGKIIGVTTRENLEMEDGFFENDAAHRLKIIRAIRTYKPDIIICNAPHDRHPDHGRSAKLVTDAAFYSGLKKIICEDEKGNQLDAWRPKQVYHYIQFYDLKADFSVNISEEFEQKMDCILAHDSQFYNPNSEEPKTLIASPEFLDQIKYRAASLGIQIGVKYAEGFVAARPLGIESFNELI